MTASIDPNTVYNSAQVARLVFGRRTKWFYAWRHRYGDQEGFPKPPSRHGHPRWRGADLLDWLSRPDRGQARMAFPGEPAAVVDIRHKLAQRSAQMAARPSGRLPTSP